MELGGEYGGIECARRSSTGFSMISVVSMALVFDGEYDG